MNIGVLFSWVIYGGASAAFAFFTLRHFRKQHETRMAMIDAAIEAEQARLRELQAAWAAEDEQYRLAEIAAASADESEVGSIGAVA